MDPITTKKMILALQVFRIFEIRRRIINNTPIPVVISKGVWMKSSIEGNFYLLINFFLGKIFKFTTKINSNIEIFHSQVLNYKLMSFSFKELSIALRKIMRLI